MKLQDRMYDAVADVAADLPTLARAAQRRGVAIRRRRRALAGVGVVATVAGLGGGGYALWPTSTDTLIDGGYATSLAARPLSGETVPNSGRATAAALLAAVTKVANGTASDVAGGDPLREDRESSAGMLFTPADGTAAGVVFVNLQPIGILGEPECLASSADCSLTVIRWRCESYMADCAVSTTLEGDTLRTYRDLQSDAGRDDERLVAELISPRREMRLVVSATNNHGEGSAATRSDPVLTLPQLTEIVTEPWWGFRLPAEYAGDDLPSYRDAGGGRVGPAEPSPAA